MKYVGDFVVTVPTDKKDTYQEIATKATPLPKEFGVLRIVECWASDIPDGKMTDFRMAVKTEEDEEVVFSWIGYPSKEIRDAANQKVVSGPRMKEFGESMSFDDKQMIYGGFESTIDEQVARRAVRRAVSPKVHKHCLVQRKKSSFGSTLLQSQS